MTAATTATTKTTLTTSFRFQNIAAFGRFFNAGEKSMADMVTRQELEAAKIDVKHAGEAVNAKKVITPRYGQPFNSFPLELDNLAKAIQAALAAGAGASGWTAELVVDGDKTQKQINDNQKEINSKVYESGILGRTGISPIVGDKNDSHYGWGGVVAYPSGKWVFICRKAAGHATLDTASLIAKDSYDNGQSWINERTILSSTEHDLRPDPPRLMAGNRGGLLVNQASVANGHFSPIFLHTDDEGVTWKVKTIITDAPYTFSSTGGMLSFPSSVGGHDISGFISFGFLSAGGFDALYTLDNGETWLKQFNVAMPSIEIGALSEWGGCRLGDTNRWIFLLRTSLPNAGGWNPKLTAYFTTDPLNWGDAVDTSLYLGGNTPSIIYNDVDNTVHIMNISRGGRAIDGLPENCIAYLPINADTAYNSKLILPGINYRVLTPLPHWATGYMAPFKVGKNWFLTVTCGEVGFNGGGNSIQVLIGDFTASEADTMKLIQYMSNQLKSAKYLELTAYDAAAYPFRLYSKDRMDYILLRDKYLDHYSANSEPFEFNSNTAFKFSDPLLLGGAVADIEKIPIQVAVRGANNPSIKSSVASAQARNHITFHNTNGLVGTISTTASATTYATTSDETLKDFEGEYDAQKAIGIIKADPVRAYTWKQSGEKSFGWGAQTSYSIDKTLATKGGWYLDDEEVKEGTKGAVYVPWGIDYSKRVPHLWAAVSYLLDEVERLKQLTEI